MNKIKLLEIAHALDLGSIDDKKARTLLLSLLGVSQRSELLLAYHRYLTEELSLDLNEIWVDEHLKANNCG